MLAWLIGMEQPFRQAGFYIYNRLGGLALGIVSNWPMRPSGWRLAGILTFS